MSGDAAGVLDADDVLGAPVSPDGGNIPAAGPFGAERNRAADLVPQAPDDDVTALRAENERLRRLVAETGRVLAEARRVKRGQAAGQIPAPLTEVRTGDARLSPHGGAAAGRSPTDDTRSLATSADARLEHRAGRDLHDRPAGRDLNVSPTHPELTLVRPALAKPSGPVAAAMAVGTSPSSGHGMEVVPTPGRFDVPEALTDLLEASKVLIGQLAGLAGWFADAVGEDGLLGDDTGAAATLLAAYVDDAATRVREASDALPRGLDERAGSRQSRLPLNGSIEHLEHLVTVLTEARALVTDAAIREAGRPDRARTSSRITEIAPSSRITEVAPSSRTTEAGS